MRENRGTGIRFLLVCPPAVNTPLINQALDTGPESLRFSQRTGRLARPEAILDAIERALEKGRWVVRPGEATALTWLRRLSPGLRSEERRVGKEGGWGAAGGKVQ